MKLFRLVAALAMAGAAAPAWAGPPPHPQEHGGDLVRDPLGQMRALYDHLGLGGFDAARPRMQEYLAENAGYQTNKYPDLSPDLRAEITRRWGDVIRKYGYGEPSADAPQRVGATAEGW